MPLVNRFIILITEDVKTYENMHKIQKRHWRQLPTRNNGEDFLTNKTKWKPLFEKINTRKNNVLNKTGKCTIVQRKQHIQQTTKNGVQLQVQLTRHHDCTGRSIFASTPSGMVMQTKTRDEKTRQSWTFK